MLGPMLLLVLVLIGAPIGVYAILMNERKKNTKSNAKALQQKLAKQIKRFNYLYDNFLTRTSFRRLVEQISGLSVYNYDEVRILSVKYYTRTMFAAVLLVAATAVIIQDVMATLLSCTLSVVLYNTLINNSLDKTHEEVLKQLSLAIGSVEEHYVRLGTIPDAINEAKRGPLLNHTFEEIYLILTDNDGETRLEEFYNLVPFQMLQTFAGVCHLLNDVGDEATDTGSSAFRESVELLKMECDMDIRKADYQRKKFEGLQWFPLIPLLLLGMIKWFFTSFIPGTSVLYNGMFGYVVQSLVIVLSTIGFYYIANTNTPSVVRQDDRSDLILRLLGRKWFRGFVSTLVPHKVKITSRLTRLIDNSLSSKNIEYLYGAKLVASIAAFLATLLLLAVFTFTTREFVYNSIQSQSLLGTTPLTLTEEQRMIELDKRVLSRPTPPRDRDLEMEIQSLFSDMTPMDQTDHVDRIIQKYENYKNARFYWWFILIAYFVAYIGWNTPEINLMFRKSLVKAEASEDVLQLQTMLYVLMFTNLNTWDTLYWLGKQSKIHHDVLVYAFHEYTSDPDLALERLKDTSSVPEFERMCDQLESTISDISLREAFASLLNDRAHMMSMREVAQKYTVDKKRNKSTKYAWAPALLTGVGYFLAPIGILGVKQFIDTFSQFGG